MYIYIYVNVENIVYDVDYTIITVEDCVWNYLSLIVQVANLKHLWKDRLHQ